MTTTLRINQRERQAAQAFRRGDTLTEIAAVLGLSEHDADDWLNSPRVDEACQAVTRSDTHRNQRKRIK